MRALFWHIQEFGKIEYLVGEHIAFFTSWAPVSEYGFNFMDKSGH